MRYGGRGPDQGGLFLLQILTTISGNSTWRRHWTCTCGCAANEPSCRNFDWICADKWGTWSGQCASPCAVSTTSDAWNPSNIFYNETTIQRPWTDRSHRPRRGPRFRDRCHHPRPLRYLLLVLQINTNTQDHLYINHQPNRVPYAKTRSQTLFFFFFSYSDTLSSPFLFHATLASSEIHLIYYYFFFL